MTSQSCLTEEKLGVLRTESSCESKLIDSLEILGEEINSVLTLMEHGASKILIYRFVAVSCIGCSCCQTRTTPVLDIIGFYGIELVTVLDVGMNIRKVFIGFSAAAKTPLTAARLLPETSVSSSRTPSRRTAACIHNIAQLPGNINCFLLLLSA